MAGRNVRCLINAEVSPGYSFLMCSIITRLELYIQYRGDTGMHSVRCNNSKLRKEMKEVKSHGTPEDRVANDTKNI